MGNDGADVCEVFQEQLDCFPNKAQCKVMLPVVKQAASSAGGEKCSFACGKTADKTSDGPDKVKTSSKSDEHMTCKTEAQKKATQQIQDATGDTEKSKKLFEEDLCTIWQDQLNCYGDDQAGCEAAVPDVKKAYSRTTQAVKGVYSIKECNFNCDGGLEASGVHRSSGAYIICLLATFLLL